MHMHSIKCHGDAMHTYFDKKRNKKKNIDFSAWRKKIMSSSVVGVYVS